MNQGSANYRIRLARPDEIARLREIEGKAATMFSGLGLIDEAIDESFSADELARLLEGVTVVDPTASEWSWCETRGAEPIAVAVSQSVQL
jgi:hypothetical protein